MAHEGMVISKELVGVETGQFAPETGQLPESDVRSLYDALLIYAEGDFIQRSAPSPSQIATAERVMAAIQNAYRERGVHQMVGIYSVLPHAHDVARLVLWRAGGESNRFAKETQIRLSSGEPLAVCTGPFRVEVVQLFNGVRRNLGQRHGCGRIFRDSTQMSGNGMWSVWCPDCRTKITQRRRAEQRRLRRG
jgi:hypothetical protein